MLNENVANKTNEVTGLDLVFISDKEVMTDSLLIAKRFEKRHDYVLRSISRLLKSNPELRGRHTFEEATYLDSQGKARPKYLLTKDATTLLVMGYTGKKAMEFKIDYINAFNLMYERLKLQKSLDEELAEAVKLDGISFMSASEAAKVMKKRQIDKPVHKHNIQQILNKQQRMFDFMLDDKQIEH